MVGILNGRDQIYSYVAMVPTLQNPDRLKTDLEKVPILKGQFLDPHCIRIVL